MRITELLEASEREKARRAKKSAQDKRAAAASNAIEPDPPKQKGIPANVPPKSHYVTNKPLRLQKDIPGAFSGSEFDAYREVEPDPNEGKGVVLKFHSVNHPKTGNPIIYAYWAHDYAPDFNDSKTVGSIRAIGELYSHATIDLIKELIKKEHAVNVLIDPKINELFAKPVKLLVNWITKNQNKPEFNDALNFEIVPQLIQGAPITQLGKVPPTADIRIPNADELSTHLMNFIRKNPELSEKYKSVTPDIRSRALSAGVNTLHKTKDINSALDDIDAMLDF